MWSLSLSLPPPCAHTTHTHTLTQNSANRENSLRAAAVQVLRYSGHQVPEQAALLMQAAGDQHGRVRLEAIAAASWLDPNQGLPIVAAAGTHPIDAWIKPVHDTALAHLKGQSIDAVTVAKIPTPTKPLSGAAQALYTRGAEVYHREGHCVTCHQDNGLGLPAAMFPPLAGTQWVQGSDERLIKLTLHGLLGPIEIKGKNYPGQVPMTQFKGLSDEDIAAVLTFVRNAFGNQAAMISPAKVKAVRAATSKKTGFYLPADLLDEHPHD